MLPGNLPSTIPVPSAFMPPDSFVTSKLIDYELGGVAINDASQGLQVQTWVGWVRDSDVLVQPQSGEGEPHVVFSRSGITSMSFCFDQNMRPAVAVTVNDEVLFYWYDSTINAYRTDSFGLGRNPRLTLDDKRASLLAGSDIILAFIKPNQSLIYRRQRDRFLTEFILRTGLRASDELRNIGMGKNWRLQFEIV